jgi:hypothetical protein
MVDHKLRDLRGPSRRRFIRWLGAAGAALAVDRSRLLDFAADSGGVALADAMCAPTNRSLHIVGGNGSFGWFQLLWPHVEVATSGNTGFAYHSFDVPGTMVAGTGGNHDFYYAPEAPWVSGGTPMRPMTALMSGSNETHTQTPNTPAVVAANASMVATAASIQRQVPTLLPVLGVGPVNLGAAPGAPSAANVPNATSMIDLFNSAASQLILAKQDDRDLYETYYKAIVGLREGAKLPTWSRHLDVTKKAAHVLGTNLGSQLTPTTADLNAYGLTALATSQASAEAKSKLDNLGRTLITAAKAFKLNLSMCVQVAMAPGASDNNFSDPHAAFNNMTSLKATVGALGTMLNAFFTELAGAPDPNCDGTSIADNLVLTVHGDTPKTPLQASGWPDNTPGNSNWVYVMGAGHLRTGWFGRVKADGSTSGYDPTSGADVAGKAAAETSTSTGAAVAYAIAKGDMKVVEDYYSGPELTGIVV